MTKIYISKLDAALRQLQTAIRLFMSNGDPVSIHTLACASQEILETLGKEEGIKSHRSTLLESIRPEYLQEVNDRIFRKSKNFFKHADKDPKDTLTFNYKQNDFVIWDASQLYLSLTQERVPFLNVFCLWMQANYPEIFIHTAEQKRNLNILFGDINPLNKTQFFTELLSVSEDSLINQLRHK